MKWPLEYRLLTSLCKNSRDRWSRVREGTGISSVINNPCAHAHGSDRKSNLMGRVFTQTLTRGSQQPPDRAATVRERYTVHLLEKAES